MAKKAESGYLNKKSELLALPQIEPKWLCHLVDVSEPLSSANPETAWWACGQRAHSGKEARSGPSNMDSHSVRPLLLLLLLNVQPAANADQHWAPEIELFSRRQASHLEANQLHLNPPISEKRVNHSPGKDTPAVGVPCLPQNLSPHRCPEYHRFLIPTTQYLTEVSHYSEGDTGVSLDHGIP